MEAFCKIMKFLKFPVDKSNLHRYNNHANLSTTYARVLELVDRHV